MGVLKLRQLADVSFLTYPSTPLRMTKKDASIIVNVINHFFMSTLGDITSARLPFVWGYYL